MLVGNRGRLVKILCRLVHPGPLLAESRRSDTVQVLEPLHLSPDPESRMLLVLVLCLWLAPALLTMLAICVAASRRGGSATTGERCFIPGDGVLGAGIAEVCRRPSGGAPRRPG